MHTLGSLLGHIAASLHEWNYLDHYARDFPDLFGLFEASKCDRNWQSLKVPFNIFQWLANCMRAQNSRFSDSLPSLYMNREATCINFSRKVIGFYELLCCSEAVSKVVSCGVHVDIAAGSFETAEQKLVLAMVGENFGLTDLDCLPAGVSLPLRHVITSIHSAGCHNFVFFM